MIIRGRKGRSKAALLAAFLLFVVFNSPLLFGLRIGGDGILLFYPTEHALSEALNMGTLPFWTPRLQSGFSLLADGQPSSLYLPNILAFGTLPNPIAHNLILVLHGLIGLLFTYLWARLLNLSTFSSAGIALIYTLTTPLSAGNLPHLETLAWTPAFFFVTESYLQSRSLKHGWLLALLVGLQWTAGFPQISFYTLVAAGIYTLVRLTLHKISLGERLKAVIVLGFAVMLGLLLAAPQILSTVELASNSIRGQGTPLNLAGERSLLPVALITFIQPGWRPFFREAGLGGGSYVGIIPMILAIVGMILGRRWNWYWPLLVMSIVTLILSWGTYNPAFPLINWLPGFSYFRVHSRFLEMTQLAILAFSAYGWDRTFEAASQKHQNGETLFKWIKRSIIVVSSFYLMAILVLYPSLIFAKDRFVSIGNTYVSRNIISDRYHLQSAEYYANKINALYDSLLQSAYPLSASILIPILVLVTIWLSIQWRNSERYSQSWPFVWAGLIIIDLAFAYDIFHPTLSPKYVQEMPKSAQIIHKDLPGRPHSYCRIYSFVDADSTNFSTDNLRLLPPNYSALWDLDHIGLYSPLGNSDYYQALQELSAVNLAFGLRPVDPEVFIQSRSLLNFLNVCYVLSRQPLTGFEEVGRDQDVMVYYNTQAFPRFFLTESSTAPDFPPLRERSYPILHSGKATILNYEPSYREFEVHSEQDAILVFTEVASHDWEVFIDGIKANETIVDSMFWNIPVTQGSHTITMVYKPAGFLTGLKMTTIGVVILLAWWIMGFLIRFRVSREAQ